jgi:hypothetical protein
MMVLLGYFLVAAISGVAASAIIGFVLTNLLIGRFERLIVLTSRMYRTLSTDSNRHELST